MRRYRRLKGSALVVTSSLLVSACGAAVRHDPSVPVVAAPGLETAAVRTGTLKVRARFNGFTVQDIQGGGYSLAEVASVTISVKDAADTILATATLGQADVYSQITFTQLPVGILTILCQAKDASGNVISMDAQSQASVTVTDSGVSSVDLMVQMANKTEQTQTATFAGIGVTAGNLVTAGPIEISTASAPTPTPAPQPVLTDNDRNVIAAGTTPEFTLAIGTYVLKIENIVPMGGGSTATWTLYANDGTTPLGSYSGNFVPLGMVTIDTAGTGNVGMLTFTTPDVDPMTVVPAQDLLTVSSGQ